MTAAFRVDSGRPRPERGERFRMNHEDKRNVAVAVTIIMVAAIIAITCITIDDEPHETAVTMLIGFAAPTILLLANLLKSDKTGRKVDAITHSLNGELDRKIEGAVERVMRRHGLCPDTAAGRDAPARDDAA